MLYLSWGAVDDVGVFTMFRRARLMLEAVPARVVEAAVRSGVGWLPGSHGRMRGTPVCSGRAPAYYLDCGTRSLTAPPMQWL